MRGRYNAFIERHEVSWELTFGFIAIVFVALGFLIDQAPDGSQPLLETIEWLLTGVFLAEFTTRILAAHDRRQYLRGHWIDLIALAPPIRAARVLRLLRLLRLVRSFAGIYRASMHVGGLARHRGFADFAAPATSTAVAVRDRTDLGPGRLLVPVLAFGVGGFALWRRTRRA